MTDQAKATINFLKNNKTKSIYSSAPMIEIEGTLNRNSIFELNIYNENNEAVFKINGEEFFKFEVTNEQKAQIIETAKQNKVAEEEAPQPQPTKSFSDKDQETHDLLEKIEHAIDEASPDEDDDDRNEFLVKAHFQLHEAYKTIEALREHDDVESANAQLIKENQRRDQESAEVTKKFLNVLKKAVTIHEYDDTKARSEYNGKLAGGIKFNIILLHSEQKAIFEIEEHTFLSTELNLSDLEKIHEDLRMTEREISHNDESRQAAHREKLHDIFREATE